MQKRYPEPTVGALIFNPHGKVFLMKSHKWKGSWVIPGGHIELGESMEDALRREIKEETDLDVHGVRFIGFQEFIFDKVFWKRKHFIFFDYSCRTGSAKVRLNCEGQEYAWVALKLPIDRYTRRAIKEYMGKRPNDKQT